VPWVLDNLLKADAGSHYQWDTRGNLVERSWNGEKTTFTWDGFDRLKSATTYGQIPIFSYDALGRRIAKRSGDASKSSDGTATCSRSRASKAPLRRTGSKGRGGAHYIHERNSFVNRGCKGAAWASQTAPSNSWSSRAQTSIEKYVKR